MPRVPSGARDTQGEAQSRKTPSGEKGTVRQRTRVRRWVILKEIGGRVYGQEVFRLPERRQKEIFVSTTRADHRPQSSLITLPEIFFADGISSITSSLFNHLSLPS